MTKAVRQDIGLPMDIGFDSLVSVSLTPFLISGNSLVSTPKESTIKPKAIGRIRLSENSRLEIFNFVFQNGEASSGKGAEFLQILRKDGEIMSRMYFQHLTRYVPKSLEDAEAYSGRGGYGLGHEAFFVGRDLLVNASVSQSKVEEVLAGIESLEYFRDGESTEEWIPPHSGVENRLFDAFGFSGMKQEVTFMPYLRELHGDMETLYISYEDMKSFNGDPANDVHVDFYVGVPLSSSDIRVI